MCRGRKICLDVARGLVHLHQRNIVHMDLKSPNILLGKDLTAKIADVGLARSITGSYLSQMTSIGTMAWAAPELRQTFKIGRRSEATRRTVTAKADVFRQGAFLMSRGWGFQIQNQSCNTCVGGSVANACLHIGKAAQNCSS